MRMMTKEQVDNSVFYEITWEQAESESLFCRILLPNGRYVAGPLNKPSDTDDIRLATPPDLSPGLIRRLTVMNLSPANVQFIAALTPDSPHPIHRPRFRTMPGNLDVWLADDPGLLAIAHSAPQNDLLRGTILKLCGKIPPENECGSFESLNAWAMANCTSPVPDGELATEWRQMYAGPDATVPVIQRRRNVVAAADYNVWERESGRCTYTATRSACHQLEITDADLRDKLEEAIDNDHSLEQVIDGILEEFEEEARNDADLEPDEDSYHYDDHETTDTDDSGCEIQNARAFKSAILAWCSDNLEAEQREALGI